MGDYCSQGEFNMFEIEEIIDEKYRIIEEIGEGGFGKVYKAKDLTNENIVAIKQCNKFDDNNLRRFKREVRIMDSIDHPNVIKVLDQNLESAIPYFVMPLAEKSLYNLIPHIYDDTSKVISYFEDICKGVIAIHSTGHTHRDIKPHNILIINENVVVSDLGLAKINERDTTVLTKTTDKILTEEYASPEQFVESGTRDLDQRGDIYMLGKTLYHLLTNQRPIIVNPDALDPGYWLIYKKATKYSKEERYQTVGQLLDAILDVKKANDPQANPDIYIDSLISTAKENLKNDQYNESNINEILKTLLSIEDNQVFIEKFNQIPEKLFPILGSYFTTDLETILQLLHEKTKHELHNYPWSFAESMGSKMIKITKNSNNPSIWRYSILLTLIVSVGLNRFAAMDQFDYLLKGINSDDIGHVVADGLREEFSDYQDLYRRLSRNDLHPAIRTVWDAYEDEVHNHS